jgi:uncharacterized protein DUF4026
MPPAMLYCGFVKYTVPGVNGVWMRTHGCDRVGLPNLAMLAENHAQGEKVFNLFNGLINQMRESGSIPASGETVQVAPHLSLSFRDSKPDEPFQESMGKVLVIEPTSIGDQPAIAMV